VREKFAELERLEREPLLVAAQARTATALATKSATTTRTIAIAATIAVALVRGGLRIVQRLPRMNDHEACILGAALSKRFIAVKDLESAHGRWHV